MARVGLFGGSFNPPHAAHQMLALYVLETQPLDELWIIPAFAHAFGKALAPYEHRVAMCELAAAPLGPRVQVSRAEAALAARPGFVASRTIDLVEHVIALGHAPRLVIGADILEETDQWHRWPDIVAAAPLIVVGRAGRGVPGGGSVETGITLPDIASSDVRRHLAAMRAGDAEAARALGGLLPRQVLGYIAREGLYP